MVEAANYGRRSYRQQQRMLQQWMKLQMAADVAVRFCWVPFTVSSMMVGGK